MSSFLKFIAFAAALLAQHSTLLLAQENRDSLMSIIQNSVTDTNRVNALLQLGTSYDYYKQDSAVLLAERALDMSKRINYTKGVISSYLNLGNVYRAGGNYARALDNYLIAQRNAENTNNPLLKATALFSIGTTYFYQGDLNNTIQYTHRARKLFIELGVADRISRANNNLGSTFEQLNQLDSALYYSKLSYRQSMQQKDKWLSSVSACNLGHVFRKLNQTDSAIYFYHSSLPGLQAFDDLPGISEVYVGLARVYQKLKQPDSTLYYGRSAVALARSANAPNEYLLATNYLSSYFQSTNNLDSAFYYLSKSVEVKDSLFSAQRTKEFQNIINGEVKREQEKAAAEIEARNKFRQNMMLLGIGAVALIALLLLRNIYQNKKNLRRLSLQKEKTETERLKAETALNHLKETQSQLIQSEKMASLGELTAGIAHEIQNPLNFVNNFAEVNNELTAELLEELEAGNVQAAKLLAEDLNANSDKIQHHGKRADAIVKSMLQHSRRGSGQKELTDINKLADEYIRLSYHGLRAKDKTFNSDFKTEFDNSIPLIEIFPQDFGRVLLNLLNNAFYAVAQRKKSESENDSYKPEVLVKTRRDGDYLKIWVKDNGGGIPGEALQKIFQPFFTTKPTGSGTGLGLSLSYDIIKAHGGDITVETKEQSGTTFIISIPLKDSADLA